MHGLRSRARTLTDGLDSGLQAIGALGAERESHAETSRRLDASVRDRDDLSSAVEEARLKVTGLGQLKPTAAAVAQKACPR